MYKEEYYDYSGKEGKWIKDELKKRGFHHVTISNFPADFFRMSKSQLEKLFEQASDAFISEMYDVSIQQIQNRRRDFDIKQLGCTINRMWREEELAQTIKEILRIVSNEYNNGNIPHTNSTPLNSEKEFLYMKATGIVRRIDDLGRVVIPKEIRRTMRIREGDPLEIYTDRDGEVIFKKYSPVGEMLGEAQGYCETLYKSCGIVVAVCDRDGVIACAGAAKKHVLEQKVPPEAERIMDERQLYCYTDGETQIPVGNGDWYLSSMMPILAEGDIIGGVMCLKENLGEVGETEKALIRTAGIFLGRQLED